MGISKDRVRAILMIAKNRLDDELELQPQTMYDISESVALSAARVAGAKNELEEVEAELFLDYKGSGDKKTEAQIKAEIVLDPSRKSAFIKLVNARRDHEEWQGLYEAWKQRGYTLSNLGELYRANYFSTDSVVSKDDLRKPVDRTYERPEPTKLPARRRTSLT